MIIASIIAIAAFPRDLTILALSFLAVGDPLATLVGYYRGRHKLFGKSLEGSLTCLVACVGVGFVYYYTGLNVPLPVILVGAAVATIAEAIPFRIDDNLPMPLLAVTAMWLMMIWW
jgi:dolichol kinase